MNLFVCFSIEAITPAFWYSPTLFSKKLVLPCSEIISIHSNGLTTKHFSCGVLTTKKRTVENLWSTKRSKQSVGDKLDIVGHELLIHANQGNWNRFAHELDFNLDRIMNDALDNFHIELGTQHGIQQARKVAMQSFVSTNEFIGKGESRQQSAFFEPKNSTKTSRKKNALNSRKRNLNYLFVEHIDAHTQHKPDVRRMTR